MGVPAQHPDEPGSGAEPEAGGLCVVRSLLGLVTNYLGTIPHLNRIDLLYSVNHGGEEAISSQIYHLDPEGTRQAKLFMNLRDVGPDEGPFTFIPAAETTRIVGAIKKPACRDSNGGWPIFRRRAGGSWGAGEGDQRVGPKEARRWWTRHDACISATAWPGTYRLCLYIQYCTSREHGNMFDASRHADDPVSYLARSTAPAHRRAVSAPHQMGTSRWNDRRLNDSNGAAPTGAISLSARRPCSSVDLLEDPRRWRQALAFASATSFSQARSASRTFRITQVALVAAASRRSRSPAAA